MIENSKIFGALPEKLQAAIKRGDLWEINQLKTRIEIRKKIFEARKKVREIFKRGGEKT